MSTYCAKLYFRYTNTRHHSGKWLNAVQSEDYIETAFDDYDGKRTVDEVNNVLGNKL